jgi:hypothetical protein
MLFMFMFILFSRLLSTAPLPWMSQYITKGLGTAVVWSWLWRKTMSWIDWNEDFNWVIYQTTAWSRLIWEFIGGLVQFHQYVTGGSVKKWYSGVLLRNVLQVGFGCLFWFDCLFDGVCIDYVSLINPWAAIISYHSLRIYFYCMHDKR